MSEQQPAVTATPSPAGREEQNVQRVIALSPRSPIPRLSFWIAVGLLFLFWLSRVHNLLALPLFLDEASHLTRAQWVWQGRPFYLLETGKMLAPYLAALFWPFSAAPFIGRYVVVILGAVGIASAYNVGRELGSRNAGLLCMALWIICPQLMFFERMALVDTTISAMAMLALWLAIRMIRSGRVAFALLCGVALALCLFAKTTGLVFMPIPILVAALLGKREKWRSYLGQIVIAYAVLAALSIGPILYIRSVNADPTGLKYGLTTIRTDNLEDRAQDNALRIWDAEQIYFSKWMLGLVIASAVMLLFYAPRKAILLLLLIAALLGAIIAVAASLWLRYASPAAPFMLIITALGLTMTAEQLRQMKLPRPVYGLPWLVAAIWAVVVGLPFQSTAYNDPRGLTSMLPSRDVVEYLQWIPSGYGIRDAAEYIFKNYTTPITVIGTAVNCNSARLYAPVDTPITFVCPESLDWGGGNLAIIEDIQQQADKDGKVLVLAEEYGPYKPIVSEKDLPTPRDILKIFSRPARDYAVVLFSIKGSTLPTKQAP